MIEHPPGDGDDLDLAVAPFEDDAERAEAAWLLAREHDPDAPAPGPRLAREYAEFEALLASLPLGLPDDSWQDDVLNNLR